MPVTIVENYIIELKKSNKQIVIDGDFNYKIK
jgi:hypothetical protein